MHALTDEPRQTDMRLVGLGFGYSARAFMRLARPSSVVGTTRSEDKADALHRSGVRSVLYHGEESLTLSEAVRHATHLLVSAGPDGDGDPFLRVIERDLAHAPDLKWIGYLSTVGVYGDHDGAVVDERASCHPTADRGVWRLEAEAAWTALGRRIAVPTAVFRLAGIYGPGRNQFVALEAGKAKRIVKPGQVFNRIHVEDIGRTLMASVERPASRVYNVADNEPAPPEEVVAYAAALMGVEPPPEVPFDEAELSPMARSFYGEVKRVSNARIRQELGVRLAHPTYREGLNALWESGRWRDSY
ncbi:SDR family oxidoreductase [Acuticoccus sp. I52.16.1]|uniref:SDR family oxidoreductase n=1 Tax=Acuticoccus sp. I52.16.1 TaxID=2928472 RepID=UPI001FD3CC58|nr:SDR family oxidoreductase [Acuticoccus sp. I52.16.1]UOM35657.1 SDR family oxidoreductase [Acuticoccus sp. I52.16.1]